MYQRNQAEHVSLAVRTQASLVNDQPCRNLQNEAFEEACMTGAAGQLEAAVQRVNSITLTSAGSHVMPCLLHAILSRIYGVDFTVDFPTCWSC